MARRKKGGMSGIGAIKRKIDSVAKQHKAISEKLRAEKQVKTLTKRLAQKVNALEKAKNSLAGVRRRKKR